MIISRQRPARPGQDARVLDALDRFRDHVNPSLAKLARFGLYDRIEWRGEGAVVYDTAGRSYIDCVATFGAVNAGHAHPDIVRAVTEQLSRFCLPTKLLLNEPMINLAAALAELTPGDLSYSFFCNSGTEAVEAALKFARLASGRPGVVSATGSFHGKTFGALSASGRAAYKEPFEPLLPGFVQVPYGDIDALRAAVSPEVGAILLEPIQGEGGVIVPPAGYLAAAREFATERDVLLLIDEVQTGFGRTGVTFAIEEEGIVPDFLILAKSLGGGVMPIGAVVGTPRVWQPLVRNPTLHSSTFGGNPLACTAALAFLEVMREQSLAKRALARGASLRRGLEEIAQRHPRVVKEVRGRGLLLGVELADIGMTAELCRELLRRGVLVFYGANNEQVVRVEPPLVITQEQVRQVITAFEDAVRRVEEVALPAKVMAS